MEIVTMAPSHHPSHAGSTHVGRSSDIYFNGLGGGQNMDDKEHGLKPSPGLQRGQDRRVNHGSPTQSLRHHDYAPDMVDSHDLSSLTWDLAASPWDMHAHMLDQQDHGERGQIVQLQMPPNRSYSSGKAGSNFAHADHPLLSAHGMLSSAPPPDFPLSASTSPGPEIISSESLAPLTPASLNLEPMNAMMTGTPGVPQQAQHCNARSTPSPCRSTTSSELLRRRSAPTGSKGAPATGKISKSGSPKSGGPTSNPSNARSAHSAIERKYRENINNKIAELHRVLCSAGPSFFLDQDLESGGYPYSRLPRLDEDDFSGADSSSTSGGQATLTAKKADVLAGAISYVRRSEKEKKILIDQLNSITAQLRHLEALVQGQNNSLA